MILKAGREKRTKKKTEEAVAVKGYKPENNICGVRKGKRKWISGERNQNPEGLDTEGSW